MLTLVALVVALLLLSSPWNVVLVATAAVVDIGETAAFVWWSRRRRRLVPAAVGAEAIVGRAGVALRRLDPHGQVRVDGEIWNARSGRTIDPGTAVVVISIDGLVLDVEPAQE